MTYKEFLESLKGKKCRLADATNDAWYRIHFGPPKHEYPPHKDSIIEVYNDFIIIGTEQNGRYAIPLSLLVLCLDSE